MPLLYRAAAPGISASPAEDNLRHFNVMILGPTQSPYEGRLEGGEVLDAQEQPRECWKSIICTISGMYAIVSKIQLQVAT